MSIGEGEIRGRLKGLHMTFGLFVIALGAFALTLASDNAECLALRVPLFVALSCMHLVMAVALGLFAGKLGKSGASVGFAAFISTPILLPFSYVRVIFWARQALTKVAQGVQVCNELDIDGLPAMKPMAKDRL